MGQHDDVSSYSEKDMANAGRDITFSHRFGGADRSWRFERQELWFDFKFLTRFLSFSYLELEKKKANTSLTLYTLSSKRHFFWVLSITKFWLIRLSIYLLHPQQEPHWLWRFSNMISSYPSVTETRKIKIRHTHTKKKKNSFDGRLLHRSSFLTWQRHERTERTFTVKTK